LNKFIYGFNVIVGVIFLH